MFFMVFQSLSFLKLPNMLTSNFSAGEEIFNSDDYGIGFYLILNGSVHLDRNGVEEESLVLYPKMYFGEKNLLLEKSKGRSKYKGKRSAHLLQYWFLT